MIRANEIFPDTERDVYRERDQATGPADVEYLRDLALERADRYREISDLDEMTWPRSTVRVASPRRHGELLRAAEREVKRSERGYTVTEVVFCVTAVMLTAGWIGFLALCANRWLV